jgi:site-specific recombinase XerD
MDNILQRFINYINVERGYSDNTIEAYKRDVGGYLTYLKEKSIPAGKAVRSRVMDYLITKWGDLSAAGSPFCGRCKGPLKSSGNLQGASCN